MVLVQATLLLSLNSLASPCHHSSWKKLRRYTRLAELSNDKYMIDVLPCSNTSKHSKDTPLTVESNRFNR